MPAVNSASTSRGRGSWTSGALMDPRETLTMDQTLFRSLILQINCTLNTNSPGHTTDHFQLGEICGGDLHGMPRGQRPPQVRRQGLKALARDGIGSQNGVNPIKLSNYQLIITDKEKNHLCGNLICRICSKRKEKH